MKQKLSNTFFGLLIVAGLSAFVLNSIPGKTYPLYKTAEQWQQLITNIEQAKGIMLRSTYPGNAIAAQMDSLSRFEQEVEIQIGGQIKSDTIKTKK